MPGSKHEAAIDAIRVQFMAWEEEQGSAFFCRNGGSVFVSQSSERNKKRRPDFAIWGPDRLNERGPPKINIGKHMNPHVIFQFSWENILEQEKLAIDDMSMYAGTSNLEPLGSPNVIYLIKAIRKGEFVHGFDVYMVRQGERIEDVPKMTFKVGVEEGSIAVAPEDMGLPRGLNPFLVELSKIRAQIEGFGVVFIAENEDE